MIDRRAFIAGTIAFSAAPLAAGAQPAGRVYRIAFLANDPPLSTMCVSDPSDVGFRNLRDGLRELGYREGVQVTFDCRSALRGGSTAVGDSAHAGRGPCGPQGEPGRGTVRTAGNETDANRMAPGLAASFVSHRGMSGPEDLGAWRGATPEGLDGGLRVD